MIPKEILKKVRHIEIRTRHLVDDMFAGQYHSAFKGQGMEFQEVREYVPGDDIRSIDWNVTARTNAPFIKEFTEERELTVFLAVDISESNAFGSSERLKKDIAAEIAAILAFAAIKNNDQVGLLLFTDDVELHVPPGKGIRHVLRVISEVLNFKPKSKKTLIKPAIDYLNQVLHRRSVIFFISDFITNEEFIRPMTITGRRHDVTNIIIGDKREQAWPRMGLVEWEDAETGERLLLDTSDKKTRLALTRLQSQRRTQLLDNLKRHGIDTMEISASEPYEKEFLRFFRERAIKLRT